MKNSYLLIVLFISCFVQQSNAQLLNRLKQKIENAAIETVESKAEEKTREETGKVFDAAFENNGDSTQVAETNETTSASESNQRGSTSESTQSSQSTKRKSTKSPFSDKEPPSSYQFQYKVEMQMINGKDVFDLSYFLPKSGNYMATSIDMGEGVSNYSVIDMDKDVMFIFMDQGGQKTRMAMNLDMEIASDDAAGEPDEAYVVTKTGNTKTILGYACQEYLIVGNDLTINAWITNDAGVHFPEGFSDVKQEGSANQDWVKDIDGFAIETVIVSTAEKKPITTTMKVVSINPSSLKINTGEYPKMSY